MTARELARQHQEARLLQLRQQQSEQSQQQWQPQSSPLVYGPSLGGVTGVADLPASTARGRMGLGLGVAMLGSPQRPWDEADGSATLERLERLLQANLGV